MILDTIDNVILYKKLSKNISTAIDFLESTDLNDLELGKHEIDGEKVFALIFDYKTHEEFEGKWEVHRKYYDIQCIIKGNEKIAVANIIDMIPVIDYIEEDDYQLFKGEGSKLLLRENDFIILGPKDVHQPGIQIGEKASEVKKIVIKAMI